MKNGKYFNVYESYEAARKAFANGDAVGCITHCRNIITGIFSYKRMMVENGIMVFKRFVVQIKILPQ